jgi:hypothetical protein
MVRSLNWVIKIRKYYVISVFKYEKQSILETSSIRPVDLVKAKPASAFPDFGKNRKDAGRSLQENYTILSCGV